MPANMVLDVFGDLMICVHTSRAPSDAEWARYIAAVGTCDVERLRTVVFTDGGAPNSEQRKLVNRALGGKTSVGGIVTGNVVVRSAVTALSWFNPKIKAFSPERTEEAFQHVGLTPDEVPAVWEIVARLRTELGVADLRCIPVDRLPRAA